MAGLVLLVHDDIAVIAAVRRLLAREGYDILLASSAADALIAFGHHLPGLMVLSPTVEGGRGHVVLEELAQHPDAALARVVLLGESIQGFPAPVVPLPLDGAFFLETVRGALRGNAPAKGWRRAEPEPESAAAEGLLPTPSALPGAISESVAPAAVNDPVNGPAPVTVPDAVTVPALPPPGSRPPAPPRLASVRLTSRLKALDADLDGALPAQARVSLEELARAGRTLALSRQTGRWELKGEDGLRVLWVEDGALVAVGSTLHSESLLERAHRDGLVDRSQLRELRLLRAASEGELLKAMRDRGYLRDSEAVPLFQRYTEQVALEALSEPSTHFRWTAGAVPEPGERAAAVRPLGELVLEGLRRGLPPEVVAVRTQGLTAVPRWRVSAELSDMGWTDRELRLLEAVDGERPTQALLLAVGVRQEVGVRALAMAEALGLLELEPQAAEAAGPADGALDVQRLNAKAAAAEEADYFELLGLPRTAGGDEVARAFKALSEEFHPLRYVGHPDPSLQTRAERLRQLLAEAAAALGDDRLRERYARHLVD